MSMSKPIYIEITQDPLKVKIGETIEGMEVVDIFFNTDSVDVMTSKLQSKFDELTRPATTETGTEATATATEGNDGITPASTTPPAPIVMNTADMPSPAPATASTTPPQPPIVMNTANPSNTETLPHVPTSDMHLSALTDGEKKKEEEGQGQGPTTPAPAPTDGEEKKEEEGQGQELTTPAQGQGEEKKEREELTASAEGQGEEKKEREELTASAQGPGEEKKEEKKEREELTASAQGQEPEQEQGQEPEQGPTVLLPPQAPAQEEGKGSLSVQTQSAFLPPAQKKNSKDPQGGSKDLHIGFGRKTKKHKITKRYKNKLMKRRKTKRTHM